MSFYVFSPENKCSKTNWTSRCCFLVASLSDEKWVERAICVAIQS